MSRDDCSLVNAKSDSFGLAAGGWKTVGHYIFVGAQR